MELRAKTTDGGMVTIAKAALEALKEAVRGAILTPADAGYDAARALWNGMIDRRPALVVRCVGVADVCAALRFAQAQRLLVAVRGAGHNIAGRGVADDVLLVDLSAMRYVLVDPDSATALVGPGATLADIDNETQAYGLALPVGINSTTGIAGLTLGGGFGWLSRKYGMTIDNLLAAELITVDGERLLCSAARHSDLFWAIRGGGGNFGVVTAFSFALHKVGPQVMCGPLVFAAAEAREVLLRYREYCREAPDEVTVWAVLRRCPPFPFVDGRHHGAPVLILVCFYCGPVEAGAAVLAPLQQFGQPLGSGLAPHAFSAFQRAFDPMLTAGARNYWKTLNFKTLDDGLIDAVVAQAGNVPTPQTELFIGQMGGQVNRIAKDATAYPHRDIAFIMNLHTRWLDPKDDVACVAWARALYGVCAPFACGGAYVNFLSEGDDSLQGAFAENAAKLKALKAQYDPANMLCGTLNLG